MYRLAALVLAAFIAGPAGAECPAVLTPEQVLAKPETIREPFRLTRAVCLNGSAFSCTADVTGGAITVVDGFLGPATSVAAAERLRTCKVKGPNCVFDLAVAPLKVEAGRRADARGWNMVTITAEMIEVRLKPCDR